MITDDIFIKVCNESSSMAEAALKLNISFSTFKRRAIKLDCYKTNQYWNKGKTIFDDNRISINKIENIFCKNSISKRVIQHKPALRKILGENCNICKSIPIWQGKYIEYELDHINGDRKDNSLENLRFLCPNCHSQTDTFRGRNSTKNLNKDGFYKYTLEQFLEAIKISKNLSEVCINLNLTPAGGNFETLKKKMVEYDLSFGVSKDIKDIKTITKKINNCSCGSLISKNSIQCKQCSYKSQQKVNRPPIEIILKDLEELGSYAKVGRKYGLSGNAIKRWLINI